MESDTGGGGLRPDAAQNEEGRLPLILAQTTQETLGFTARTKHTSGCKCGCSRGHQAQEVGGSSGKEQGPGCADCGDSQWVTGGEDRRCWGAREGCIVPIDESTVRYLGASSLADGRITRACVQTLKPCLAGGCRPLLREALCLQLENLASLELIPCGFHPFKALYFRIGIDSQEVTKVWKEVRVVCTPSPPRSATLELCV